ncbi:MAG: hypothetical protein IPG44_14765 [Anaerolineales bacterium]|jgi:hypothetical protein|nr:hypothetical protein [Chloroflexota bacterium]MBK6646981.1 hypothetical protein [Anaerolineales bacterium]
MPKPSGKLFVRKDGFIPGCDLEIPDAPGEPNSAPPPFFYIAETLMAEYAA